MRFLCLHGIGSNSRIFEQQTAAIRYQLGDSHTYDFVNGTFAWQADPKLQQMLEEGEQTFSYCDPDDANSCAYALEQLNRHLELEGPYDGVMGFSMGANVALSYILHKEQEVKTGRATQLPFKFGILFSTIRPPYDCAALENRTLAYLDPYGVDNVCMAPTAHIWGTEDPHSADAQGNTEFFHPDSRFVFRHGRDHQIPSAPEDVVSMVKVIRRVLMLAPS